MVGVLEVQWECRWETELADELAGLLELRSECRWETELADELAGLLELQSVLTWAIELEQEWGLSFVLLREKVLVVELAGL